MKRKYLLKSLCSKGFPRFAKPLGFTVVCLGLMFLFGSQKLAAQTMTEVGEVKMSHAFELIEGEMVFLGQEIKDPAATVNTDKNFLVNRYYENVLNAIIKGKLISEAFMSVNGVSNADGMKAQYPQLAEETLAFLNLESSEIKVLGSLVNQLDLSDNDDSDLEAIFSYWRTLKNQ